ncbi:MAG: ATP-grasp domain-containing protein [Deltaproteobacteria bacterium]|nr:ATP-grasp domain-containing protein [Deltaproteobacteria bacterium]MBN2674615.1 ATP-grasp domain-containing protein [Deltaproteobacteria bacterium]
MKKDNKTILFVAGSLEAVPAIKRAKEMGYHTVVSDGNEHAPCFSHCEDTIIASTYDVADSTAKAVHFHQTVRPIDGVICVASDVPLTVATIAKELGLPGISVESAQIAQDKLLMKERFKRDNIAIPWFKQVDSPEHLKSIAAVSPNALIIKPVDSRGARGVQRLLPNYDLTSAFFTAKENSPTGRVMVEEYIDGPQVSTESIVLDGSMFTPGFSDRNYSLIDKFAPHMIEDGGDLPSFLATDVQDKIKQLVAAGAASMGITRGVVKGDIVVKNGEPYIIELAARLSGGYFCTHEIPMSTGVDLVGAALRIAVNDPVDEKTLIPVRNDFISQRYMFPQPGVVHRITGVQKVSQREEIGLLEIRVQPGDRVEEIKSHPGRAGVVIARGKSREDAARNAEQAILDIHFEVK